GNRIFDSATGVRYTAECGNVGGYAGGNNSDRYPIAYDFYQPGDPRPDGNGVFGSEAAGLELAAGDRVYTVDIGTVGQANSGDLMEVARLQDNAGNTGDGFTSLADINGDGRMDIAVMDGGRVYAWDPYTQQQIGTLYDVAGGAGGRINIGDFNGDGDVELGFAGQNEYVVLEYNPGNNTFGELWIRTGLDDGSQRTGSTLFDFDGDGVVEVVYSDEAFLYVYRGTDGQELLRIPSESGTRTEYPLVADVNGDGTAEIIVTAQFGNGPQFSGSGWVTVYTSANQPWVPTRPVWNQHGYNVVNVNDDLTIPAVQQDPLHPTLIADYNNFLVQTPVRNQAGVNTFPAADAMVSFVSANFDNCPLFIDITVTVTNTGAAPLPASTPIAVYDGNPLVVSAQLLDVFTIDQIIAPGDMLTLTRPIDLADYTEEFGVVYINVNDPGFSAAELPFTMDDFPATGTPECDYNNNVTPTPLQPCGEICDDGTDNDGDGITDEPNVFAPLTRGCAGATLPQFTADVGNGNGTYTVLSSVGTNVDADGQVTLGTNLLSYPDVDTIVFAFENCTDTVLVTIEDAEVPTLVCPGNQSLPLDETCSVSTPDLLNSIQRSDNCSAQNDITLAQSPAIGDPLSLGNNTITITATDEAGNMSTCTVTITTIDQISPQLNCTNELTVMANASCQGVIPDLGTATNATDNCTALGGLIIDQAPTAGTLISSNASNFVQTVQVSVMDESGNESTCAINVRIEDQTPATVVCPTGPTLVLDPNDCTSLLPDFLAQVTAEDNCSSGAQIQLIQNPSPGTILTTDGV
ncbi:MAG: FG-GAP-like repeat-containing protein, partial [Bacteroidota bacterium]